jgi:hypothetical protein
VIRTFKPCNERHAFVATTCILDRNHAGRHWGSLSESRFLEWGETVGRVVTQQPAGATS